MGHAVENIPSWLKITIFLLILTILGIFGDLFTFLLGAIITILVFANGYDADHSHDH